MSPSTIQPCFGSDRVVANADAIPSSARRRTKPGAVHFGAVRSRSALAQGVQPSGRHQTAEIPGVPSTLEPAERAAARDKNQPSRRPWRDSLTRPRELGSPVRRRGCSPGGERPRPVSPRNRPPGDRAGDCPRGERAVSSPMRAAARRLPELRGVRLAHRPGDGVVPLTWQDS